MKNKKESDYKIRKIAIILVIVAVLLCAISIVINYNYDSDTNSNIIKGGQGNIGLYVEANPQNPNNSELGNE